MYHLVNS